MRAKKTKVKKLGGNFKTKYRKNLRKWERKPQKVKFNSMFAKRLADFCRYKRKQHIYSIHLDGENAMTMRTLYKTIPKKFHNGICAINKNKKSHAKMKKSIQDIDAKCIAERANVLDLLSDDNGIDNDGKNICAYMDFNGMWKNTQKDSFIQLMKHYYTDKGSVIAYTLSLAKRAKRHAPTDPNTIMASMRYYAKKYNKDLSLEHSEVYGGKGGNYMFFVMWKVV